MIISDGQQPALPGQEDVPHDRREDPDPR